MDCLYIQKLKEILVEKGENENDIADACDYATNLFKLGLPVIFDKRHLAAVCGVTNRDLNEMIFLKRDAFYRKVSIPKKNGGERILDIPLNDLRNVQRWLLDNILSKLYISDYAMGFRKGKSIVSNARMHVGKRCLVNLDLKDFFSSISQEQVFNIFYYYGYTIELAYTMSMICTYEEKLPQGASTSPCISNIICIEMDKRLSELAKRFKATYSRYADDITFSANTDISNIIPIVSEIVCEEGFEINDKKTRVIYDYQRQEVTGLLVNGNRVRVPRKYIRKIKQEIYYCKKYGVDNHLSHIGNTKRFYREHMYGKAYYIKMIDNNMGKKLIEDLDTIDWEWNSCSDNMEC